jgi:hypothetical protein
MVDVQTVSIAVASVGVSAAAIYYIFQIRHQDRMRHLDLFMRLYSIWGSRDMLDAHRSFFGLKIEDYDSLVKEHGPLSEPSQLYTNIDHIGWFFNLMGFLVKEKIVNIKLVDELLGYWVIKNWENIYKTVIYGARKQYNIPESYQWFEYLYNEMKKREQKLQPKA